MSTGSFGDLVRGIINAKPLLLRPTEASIFVGSPGMLEAFRCAAWINPLFDRHRLVLYSVRQLEDCVARLETGEKPDPHSNQARPAGFRCSPNHDFASLSPQRPSNPPPDA